MRNVWSDFLADAGSESSLGYEQDRIHVATGTTAVRGNRARAAIYRVIQKAASRQKLLIEVILAE